jgi:hypothetical protein
MGENIAMVGPIEEPDSPISEPISIFMVEKGYCASREAPEFVGGDNEPIRAMFPDTSVKLRGNTVQLRVRLIAGGAARTTPSQMAA